MLSKANRSAATKTTTRVQAAPESGLCVTCMEGCKGLCEVGRSAILGREVLYPGPFGKITAGGEKKYPVNFSHLNIQGTCCGAVGVEADSDKATFLNADVTTQLGNKSKISLKVPCFPGALGSTDIAKTHWDGLAVGAAICGTLVTVGENVCGMDPEAEIKNGRVVRSPEMERRVEVFKRWHDGQHGDIIVQANVEDGRLGVPEYVIEKLGVETFELKWGQGAKNIGGEVRLPSLERASQLKERGYIVLPDPANRSVQEQYKAGGIHGFERHSRLGMVVEEDFYKAVEHLRKVGAKRISLKTGAYRPADLARAVKFASNAQVDMLIVDGAGGGTGMSPWRMMNEWGVPTLYLESLLYDYLRVLDEQGAYLPSVAVAGGLSLEDHLFKAIALGAPYVKAVCLGRAILTAVMVGNTQGNLLRSKVEGAELEDGLLELFAGAAPLKERYGKEFSQIPFGAIGMYTYFERLAQGLQQLMAGARKFALRYLERSDLAALTREAAEVTGIPYIMDADRDEAMDILKGNPMRVVHTAS